MKFIFDQPVHDLGVRGVYFNIHGMKNLPSSDPRVMNFIAAQLAAVPPDIEDTNRLRGFHELHAKVAKRTDKLLPSSAALLSYFRARHDIPRINGIVDVYNSVSIRSGLAIGAHDLMHVKGDIALRLCRGDERYWPLGALKPTRATKGEYAYIDSSNEILCRLEVRQVEKTKITAASHDVFFIVQGHRSVSASLLDETADVLVDACLNLFGGVAERLYPASEKAIAQPP
jgi:DNA/RNA-binding domain of Phe-tRNA-synthetase-like protein